MYPKNERWFSDAAKHCSAKKKCPHLHQLRWRSTATRPWTCAMIWQNISVSLPDAESIQVNGRTIVAARTRTSMISQDTSVSCTVVLRVESSNIDRAHSPVWNDCRQFEDRQNARSIVFSLSCPSTCVQRRANDGSVVRIRRSYRHAFRAARVWQNG